MRLSNLFSRTLRDAPADADLASHALLVRAGMVRPLASGLYAYLPLGWQVLRRIQAILRHEMETIGAQEIHMPFVNPAELWQRSGRWYEVGDELVRFRDRAERDLVLAMTHEETVTDIAGFVIQSYRDLPAVVYHIMCKMRDEPRPRGGLIRMREFLMKDAYSFHTDAADLDHFFSLIRQAYVNIYRGVGLQPILIEALSGMMGGSDSVEFTLPHPLGEDQFVECADCGYAANLEVAVADKGRVEAEEPLPLTPVDTPGAETIADLALMLDTPPERIAKSVWYTVDEADAEDAAPRLVVALVRGDLEVDERRLCEAVGVRALRPATPAEMAQVGAVAGYASAIGLDRSDPEPGEASLTVVADDTIPATPNLVAGANQPNLHYRNATYGRDFTADVVTNIVAVREGDTCPRCQGTLHLRRGIELGHIFKLGTRYSETMGATYLNSDGQALPLVMGSYGIGLDRLMAAIVEAHHDDLGIVWPAAVAPADLHLVALKAEDPAIREMAEGLYADLRIHGYRVLLDDRAESAGVKFADADLIGVPLRLTLSPRTLAKNSIEVKPRLGAALEVVALDDLYAWLEAWRSTP
ncbi:MAG: proline--tRNA ligase [Anaerolineae bacterium]|nr:proline--tRNA ligase [Anaerolineae bacterium]